MAVIFDRITQSPDLLAGRATVRGLRISVAHVVNLVANGMTPAQIQDIYDLKAKNTSGTDKEIGSGLGLLLTQQLLQKTGSKLHIESDLKKWHGD